MSTKNRTRRTTTRNIRFPNQMIEQINIALEQKGPGISQPGSWSLPSETNVKREHIHQLKVMKNEHPAFFPSEQDDIVNSLNYEGIAVIELQFYHFPDIDRPVLALSQTKWIWMISSYGDQSATRE